MNWNRFFGAIVFVLLCPATAFAVAPMPHLQNPPLLSYPCDPASHPCNSCGAFSMNEAYQVQGSARSPRSDDTPDPQFGACNGFNMWCTIAPQLQTPSYSVIPMAPGQVGIRISVGYDFPNNYCQVWDLGDSCAASNWPAPLNAPGQLTRLQLIEGGNTIYEVPAIFENGTWQPTILVSCDGTTHTYTIRATNTGGLSGCVSPSFVTTTIVVTFPDNLSCRTPDLRPCPGCSAGGDL